LKSLKYFIKTLKEKFTMKKLTAILLTSALLLSITVSATTSGITFTHNIEPGSLAIGKWGTQVIIENPDELKLEVESIEANRSSKTGSRVSEHRYL